MENKAWYAVWARSRHERIVEKGLWGKGLTAFLPTVSCPSRRTDRRKMLNCPLFPGYLFFYGTIEAGTQLAVLQTPGVVRMLSGSPEDVTPVPTEQVEAIRKLVASALAFAVVPYFRAGERVRIKDGPLPGVEGIIQQYNSRKSRLVISADLLQRSVAVELDGWRLERI